MKRQAQKNKQKGYAFEHEVIRGLEMAEGCIVYKIPDAKTMAMLTTHKSPADIIFSNRGEMFTIECKHTTQNRFPWANISQHQIEWIMSCKNAWLLIHMSAHKKVFLVTKSNLRQLLSEFPSSVPLPAFESICVELERKTARYNPIEDKPFIDFSPISLSKGL